MVDVIYDIETNGLNAQDDDRVCAIAVKIDDIERVFIGPDEKTVLTDFWDQTRQFKDFRLVGFNSASFDLPFLLVRSFKHGVIVPNLKYRSVDLRLVLSMGNKFAKGKLEDYAKLIGAPMKLNNWSGAQAIILWKEGRYDELSEYVLQDVRITDSILQRCKQIGVI
jgi:uncharacterized protein YprB with RNaseH-like and TPR domain